MKKAFVVKFPTNEDEVETEVDNAVMDDDDIWEDLSQEDQNEVTVVLLRNCRKQQLNCFAHTLQLVISVD